MNPQFNCFDPHNLSVVCWLVQTLHSPVFFCRARTHRSSNTPVVSSFVGEYGKNHPKVIWQHSPEMEQTYKMLVGKTNEGTQRGRSHQPRLCVILERITAATFNKMTAKCKYIVYSDQTGAQRWCIWLEGWETVLTVQQVLHCKSYLVVTAFIGDWKYSANSFPAQKL